MKHIRVLGLVCAAFCKGYARIAEVANASVRWHVL
jgi:hypothetical protein